MSFYFFLFFEFIPAIRYGEGTLSVVRIASFKGPEDRNQNPLFRTVNRVTWPSGLRCQLRVLVRNRT